MCYSTLYFSANTVIVARVNPLVMLPQAIINFAIKKLAGLMLWYFQDQVKKVVADPSSAHAARIRSNPEFSSWSLFSKSVYISCCAYRIPMTKREQLLFRPSSS
jgi:hypothetical protein